MKTIKQVSDLTVISVRMLHYYDKIGLLKPTGFTGAGYRLYDDEALETKRLLARFFMERMMPETATRLARITAGADSVMALSAEAF